MLEYQILATVVLLVFALLMGQNHLDYRRPRRSVAEERDTAAPRVSVLVPARNEIENIADCLAGLLRQDYPNLEILVLDDGSTDGSTEAVLELAAGDPRLRLARGQALPDGWAGKAHACWQAAQHADGEWLLFVDADTRHAPALVSAAVSAARERRADLVSTFPRQIAKSLGEALTAPMIYWVLFVLLPIRTVSNRRSAAFTAACGQFLLVRREAYFAVGGHQAIRGSLHDGLHLARLFKRRGLRVALVDLSEEISCRMYRGWRECWLGFSRNAFQAVGSLPILMLLTGVQGAFFLAPFLFLGAAAVLGWPAWSGLVLFQVLLLLLLQATLRDRFHYPWTTVILFPLALGVLLAIQWRSWWVTVRGTTLVWKEREVRSEQCLEG